MKNLATSSSYQSVFDRTGIAARSDFASEDWRLLFPKLEQQQNAFLAFEPQFRSRSYKWPRDALHWWSRAWEYPYSFHHLRALRQSAELKPMKAVDLGSGVTFFPFAVARLGYEVICCDTDTVCETDLSRAVSLVDHSPGTVKFRLCQESRLPFENNEVDVVYCVSVLEHIPDCHRTVTEIARILKPGGMLVLTIDLDLRGDAEIGAENYRFLLGELHRYFTLRHPERTVHPLDMLTTLNGPYPPRLPLGVKRAWFLLKQQIKRALGKSHHPLVPFMLGVQGFVMTKIEHQQ